VFEKFGLTFHYVDMTDVEKVRSYVNKNTKLIWVETPTNPLINIIDLAAMSAIAKQHKLLLAVDNTFASPYLQLPLNWVPIS
jgi:cystathionine beta-lyase